MCVAQIDADEVKKLTKPEMVDKYRQLIHSSSKTRAKLSVWATALGALPADEKIAALVKELALDGNAVGKLNEWQKQQPQSDDDNNSNNEVDVEKLRQFLVKELWFEDASADEVVALAKSLQQEAGAAKDEITEGETQKIKNEHAVEAEGESQETTENDRDSDGKDTDADKDKPKKLLRPAPTPAIEPVFITDVWAYKASLAVSEAAVPVQDLSEFEDHVAKL